jgi:hypothetical protein
MQKLLIFEKIFISLKRRHMKDDEKSSKNEEHQTTMTKLRNKEKELEKSIAAIWEEINAKLHLGVNEHIMGLYAQINAKKIDLNTVKDRLYTSKKKFSGIDYQYYSVAQ